MSRSRLPRRGWPRVKEGAPPGSQTRRLAARLAVAAVMVAGSALGATAATSPRARPTSAGDRPERPEETMRGGEPDSRTGRGGAMSGAATARTCAASVTTSVAANATPTFGIFATGSGTIANSPGTNRVFVTFSDSGGVLRGETSVAIRTQ